MGYGVAELFQFSRKCEKCGREVGDHGLDANGGLSCQPDRRKVADLLAPGVVQTEDRIGRPVTDAEREEMYAAFYSEGMSGVVRIRNRIEGAHDQREVD